MWSKDLEPRLTSTAAPTTASAWSCGWYRLLRLLSVVYHCGVMGHRDWSPCWGRNWTEAGGLELVPLDVVAGPG